MRPVVEVWALRPGATLAAWLSPAELARTQRLRRPDDRARSITAAALLRRYAALRLGAAPRDIAVVRRCPQCGGDDHGVPSLPGLPGTHVSLSHSGEHVLLAAASSPVGVDVEVGDIGPAAAQLGDLPPGLTAPQAWVRTEAVAKLTGRGLLLPFDQVHVTAGDPWSATVSDRAHDPGPITGIDLPLDVPAAVAVAAGGGRLDLHWRDHDPTRRRVVRLDLNSGAECGTMHA